MNILKKMLLPVLLLTGGVVTTTSCTAMKEYASTIFEETVSMSCTVVHAGPVTYSEGVQGKGKTWSKVGAVGQGYSQKIVLKTSDGKQYKYTYHPASESAAAYTGAAGMAEIGVKSKSCKGFEPSY